ncbi:hypothetical protein GYMLUDRAFT_240636 [Collybiopsis luxurians FD-317 M1]|nr:hypothetical protein GYMLUDRAFT_240636 [Collybiopsis luxurians FD-317 M1]
MFGHQWPCQIIYHLRKTIGYGLSDGEGAERLWHSLSRLIAYGRVAGFHVHMYHLDSQLEFANEEGLFKLGSWLRCKLFACDAKWMEATQVLASCGFKEQVLYNKWEKQVQVQTKPLPRQRKNQGKIAVKEVLRLRKSHDALRDKVFYLRNLIINPSMPAWDVATYELELQSVKENLMKMEVRVAKKEQDLGASSNDAICHLLNKNLSLIDWNDHTESNEALWSYLILPEQHINEHTQDSVRRREPAIAVLAHKYNTYCEELKRLIDQRKAPQLAIAPKPIDLDNIFNLDVDDDIWLDIGFGYDEDTAPPFWLSNEQVRNSIRALLDRDRCAEERRYLLAERDAMQEWFSEEWHVVNAGTRSIASDELPTWGPSEEEVFQVHGELVLGGGIDAADEEGFDVEFEAEANGLLTEHLDNL